MVSWQDPNPQRELQEITVQDLLDALLPAVAAEMENLIRSSPQTGGTTGGRGPSADQIRTILQAELAKLQRNIQQGTTQNQQQTTDITDAVTQEIQKLQTAIDNNTKSYLRQAVNAIAKNIQNIQGQSQQPGASDDILEQVIQEKRRSRLQFGRERRRDQDLQQMQIEATLETKRIEAANKHNEILKERYRIRKSLEEIDKRDESRQRDFERQSELINQRTTDQLIIIGARSDVQKEGFIQKDQVNEAEFQRRIELNEDKFGKDKERDEWRREREETRSSNRMKEEEQKHQNRLAWLEAREELKKRMAVVQGGGRDAPDFAGDSEELDSVITMFQAMYEHKPWEKGIKPPDLDEMYDDAVRWYREGSRKERKELFSYIEGFEQPPMTVDEELEKMRSEWDVEAQGPMPSRMQMRRRIRRDRQRRADREMDRILREQREGPKAEVDTTMRDRRYQGYLASRATNWAGSWMYAGGSALSMVGLPGGKFMAQGASGIRGLGALAQGATFLGMSAMTALPAIMGVGSALGIATIAATKYYRELGKATRVASGMAIDSQYRSGVFGDVAGTGVSQKGLGSMGPFGTVTAANAILKMADEDPEEYQKLTKGLDPLARLAHFQEAPMFKKPGEDKMMEKDEIQLAMAALQWQIQYGGGAERKHAIDQWTKFSEWAAPLSPRQQGIARGGFAAGDTEPARQAFFTERYGQQIHADPTGVMEDARGKIDTAEKFYTEVRARRQRAKAEGRRMPSTLEVERQLKEEGADVVLGWDQRMKITGTDIERRLGLFSEQARTDPIRGNFWSPMPGIGSEITLGNATVNIVDAIWQSSINQTNTILTMNDVNSVFQTTR